MTSVPKKSTYQVIHDLPDSVSESQKDSAVQAYFHPGENNQYSQRPDTLGLPGQRRESKQEVLLKGSVGKPQSYADSLAVSHRQTSTVVAEPAPYLPRTDNMVSGLLLAGVVVGLVSLAASWPFVVRMAKNFFFGENERTTTVPDTSSELRHQGLLVAVTAVLVAIAVYCYYMVWSHGEFFIGARHQLLGICLAVVVAYFLTKALLYQFVNWVFFERKKILQWNKSALFLTAMEGVVLAPFVLMLIYGNVPVQTMLVIIVIVAILVKVLTFYKCYLIFFRRIGAFLQIILYFCALEMIPLVITAGLLETINNYLKINF